MQIDSSVDEADIGKIQADQPVKFTVDAYPDITFEGKVTQIRNAPVIVQNVVTYDVVVKVDNSELKLKPGMTANISINVAHNENVLKIPNAAVRFKPFAMVYGKEIPEEKSIHNMQHQIYIPTNDGKIKAIPVELGISDDNFTELIKGDLKEGDKVIVGVISDGAKPPSTPSMPRRVYP